MNQEVFAKLEALAIEPAAMDRAVEYVTRQLRIFAKKQDRMLICFPNKPGSVGNVIHRAVEEVGAVPVHWGDDPRWSSLLRTAFLYKTTAIFASPLVILGLNKLSKVTKTPLYIRHALMAGHPSFDWLLDGLVLGMDCQTWGYFNPGGGGVICGQSCGASRGVHIRYEEYDVDIVDETGSVLPDGQIGEICIIPKMDPTLRLHTYDRARIDRSPCPCGRPAPRLMDIKEGRDCDPDLLRVAAELHQWDSVLDAKVSRGEYGLELEMIVFPGLMLPKLPNFAKLVVRNWDPENDEPFWFRPSWKSPVESTK